MKKYRANTCCPDCKAEHCDYTVELTEKEQEQLDQYYKDHIKERAGKSNFANMLNEIKDKPLVIKRIIKCRNCHKEYEASLIIFRSNEIGYSVKSI